MKMSCGEAPNFTAFVVVSGAVAVPAWLVIWSHVTTFPAIDRTIDADHGPRVPATTSEMPSPTRRLAEEFSVQPVGEVPDTQVAENLMPASLPPYIMFSP